MNEYWIVCDTMHRANWLYRQTRNVLKSMMVGCEQKGGKYVVYLWVHIKLIFTSEDEWWHKYRYGGHDVNIMTGTYFEKKLDDFELRIRSQQEVGA